MRRWLGLLFIILFSFSAWGDPVWIRLSYEDDPASSISVSWNTALPSPSVVQYGLSPNQLQFKETGESSLSEATELPYVHTVKISELTPETTYYYTVGGPDEGASHEYSFTTAKKPDASCADFRFAFVSDQQQKKNYPFIQNAWNTISIQAQNHAPAFFLGGGDIVSLSSSKEQWADFMDWSSDVAPEMPFMSGIGNHDVGPGEGDDAYINQLFAWPRSEGPFGSGTEDYYHFTYGNAVFVVLSLSTFRDGEPPYQQQASYLDEVLSKTNKLWKFVVYHQPSYTSGLMKSNALGQNEVLIPIIDKHHVDIVFSGHNHWYERYHPSACGTQGNPGATSPCTVGKNEFEDGTVFIVAGGAGAGVVPELFCTAVPGQALCSGNHHYIIVKIVNDNLVLETWSAFPEENKIIDTIVIEKPGVTCTVDSMDAGANPVKDSGSIEDDDTESEPQDAASTIDSGEALVGGSAGCGCTIVGAR